MGFEIRTDLDDCIAALNSNGIEAVADVVYNHRDGGAPELNPAVEGWIESYNCTKPNSGGQPLPFRPFSIDFAAWRGFVKRCGHLLFQNSLSL